MAVTLVSDVQVVLDSEVHVSCNVWFPRRFNRNPRISPEQQLDMFQSGDVYDLVFEIVSGRKDDVELLSTYSRHTFFAQQGFVSICVDARGTGDSGGRFDNGKTNASDLFDLIRYFRTYEWSSGKVFLFGVGRHASDCLTVAAKYSKLVTGVVAVGLTDEVTNGLYHQGCLLPGNVAAAANESLACGALPAVRNFSKEAWVEKLELTTPVVLFEELSKQNLKPVRMYADHTNAKKAICPVLLVAGLQDHSACNLAFELSGDQGINSRGRVIVGPWSKGLPGETFPRTEFDLMGLSVLWFRQDHRVVLLPRLTAYSGIDRTWLSVVEVKTETYTVHLESKYVRLKDQHIFQDIWGGAWAPTGAKDLPSDQSMPNEYSDSWEVPMDNFSTICGVPKLFIEFKNAPMRFNLSATLCESNNGTVKQISSGLRYVFDAKAVILELGAVCHTFKYGQLTVALKISGFPNTPSLPVESPVVVANLDVRVPVLHAFCDPNPLLEMSSPHLPQVEHKVSAAGKTNRSASIQLNGEETDVISVVSEVEPSRVNFPNHEIDLAYDSKDTAEVEFGLRGPARYTAAKTYTLCRDGYAYMSTAKTEVIVDSMAVAASSVLETFCDGAKVFSSKWERQFSRNS